MEVVGEAFVVTEDGAEVALDEVETLDHAVGLKEVGFGEDEHHKAGEQLLIFD